MKRAFIKGNDAVICGAIAAGCRAFFGYPITPASEIAHDAMRVFPEAGGLALQAESEVAAIHMLYGAGAAGTAAMTATSGPGLSLMQDGISYMAAAGIPGVIVDVMRSGPGLGNIGPEQGDYFVATKGGGHGHYHTPVYAPASVQEMFDLTRRAFDTAFAWHTPVFVVADAFIGQMMETVTLPDDLPAADAVPAVASRFDGAVDGTSDTRGRVVSSLELVPARLHDRNDARFAAYRQMERDLPMADVDAVEAPLAVVVAFGICARIAHDAVAKARGAGISVTMFRPVTLWPFPIDALRSACPRSARIIAVECNRGMMIEDLQRILLRDDIESVQADGGILPTAEDVFGRIVHSA